MAGKPSIYYWDSNLFLAWLKDETTRKAGEMDGVRDFISKVEKREISIITSVITHTEVTASKLPAGAGELFDDLMKRRNLRRICVDMRIAKLASNLRNYYMERPDQFNNKTLTPPDAIHLATAILYKVEEFHTFDEKNSNGSLGLIPLNGNVAGHKLIICKPEAKQPGLDLK